MARDKQSLGDWAKQNERQDILDMWDYNKNPVTPFEVGKNDRTKILFPLQQSRT